MTFAFDRRVPSGGYAWWYLDALADDGRHGLTLIAFVGSVFSPYYFRARRNGATPDPENHVAVNVALYGPRHGRWAMTERGAPALERSPDALVVGPSRLEWTGRTLEIALDEIAVPIPGRLQGQVRVHPEALVERRFALTADGRHHWRPVAPRARIEVRLERPRLAWDGEAYLDSNQGAEPLEDAFASWHWSRAHQRRRTLLFYDLVPRHEPCHGLALAFDPHHGYRQIEPPPLQPLPATLWRMPRAARLPDPARVQRTFEDTPFYARSLVAGGTGSSRVTGVQESLSLDRFRSGWVQPLLPFRMPRRAHRRRQR